jgi:hypothetical protein
MNTLFDFMTHVKNIEYLLALGFIAGFLVFNELLKPKPFGTLINMVKEERIAGFATAMKTIGKIVAAPFVGLAYIAILPFAFVAALGSAVGKSLVPAVSFGWRPVESYLTGRKKKAKK